MRILHWLRRRRTALIAILATLVVSPVLSLPYADDDTFNRLYARLSWSESAHELFAQTKAWVVQQGRFFPGSGLYSLGLWHMFDSRAAYMTFLLLLDLAVVAVVCLAVRGLTGSPDLALAALAALVSCMEFRFWFADGLLSFAGLIPWTLLLTMLTGIFAALALRTGHRRWAVASAVVWALAITGYEVSLLMLPALLLLLLVSQPGHSRTRWMWAVGPVVVLAALQFIGSAILHSRATDVVPSYQIRLDGPVAVTFLKQWSAALPASQYWLGGTPSGVHLYGGLTVMLVLVFALPIALAGCGRNRVLAVAVPRRIAFGLIGAGAWAWVVPSLLAAVTARWQDSLVAGQGYIYLPYEYVGVALVSVGLLGLIAGPDQPRWARVVSIIAITVFLVGMAVAASSNIVYAGQFSAGPQFGIN